MMELAQAVFKGPHQALVTLPNGLLANDVIDGIIARLNKNAATSHVDLSACALFVETNTAGSLSKLEQGGFLYPELWCRPCPWNSGNVLLYGRGRSTGGPAQRYRADLLMCSVPTTFSLAEVARKSHLCLQSLLLVAQSGGFSYERNRGLIVANRSCACELFTRAQRQLSHATPEVPSPLRYHVDLIDELAGAIERRLQNPDRHFGAFLTVS